MMEAKSQVNITYAAGERLHIDHHHLMDFLLKQRVSPDRLHTLQIQVVQHHPNPKYHWADGLYESRRTKISVCTWGLGRSRILANLILLHELKHFLEEQGGQEAEIERLSHIRDGIVMAICLLMMGRYQAHPYWYLRALLAVFKALCLHYLLDPHEIRANAFLWRHRHEQFFL